MRKGIPKIQPDLIKKWKEKVMEKMIPSVKVESMAGKPAQSVGQTAQAPIIPQRKNVEKRVEEQDEKEEVSRAKKNDNEGR